MKLKKWIAPFIIIFLVSGCVIYSFYPIYTPDDLFENDLILGDYISSNDSASWCFTHSTSEKNDVVITNRKEYKLEVDENNTKKLNSTFEVHLIKIEDQLFADFFLKDYHKKEEGIELSMFDLHTIPVHTFAKLTLYDNDSIKFHWFDSEWFKKQIENDRIEIRHENNQETILLTADPMELQNFVRKYMHTSEAFKNGLELMLYKREGGVMKREKGRK